MSLELLKQDFNVFRAGYSDQIESGFRPRKDSKPVRLSLPLNWNMDPLKDRNWCFQLHAWRMLPPIWSEFYGKDWVRLKSEVLPWIRDWYRYHIRQRKTSAFMWYDMAAGLRAQHLALLLHLHQRGVLELEQDEIAELEELAILHVNKLRNPAFISKGNHGIFQLVGLRLLGIVRAGSPDVEGEEAYSSEQMRRLIDSQFGPQGVHVENSPDYHNFAVAHFSRIRPALFPSISEVFDRKLKDARAVAPWFTLPDGSIAAIGDSEGAGPRLEATCRHDAESLGKWDDKMLMRDLSDAGYVTVRSSLETPPYRAEMLIVKGQAITNSHAHADHLGFEFYVHGRPLLVDSGKFTYNKTAWRNYFACDRAHNVVGLDGIAYGPYDTVLEESGLTLARRLEGSYIIEGKVARAGNFAHRRRFTYTPGDRLTLEDEIDAPEDGVPVAYFHLAAHADVEASEEGLVILVGGRSVATLIYPLNGFEVRIRRGQEEPWIQGWLSPSYGKRVPSSVIELVGTPDLRAWRVDFVLHEPSVSSDLLQRAMPSEMQIPFVYSCRSDRVLPRDDGTTERRIMVEYYSGDPTSIDGLMSEMFESAGFLRERSRPEQEGIRAYYAHGDSMRVNVLIRPQEAFQVRSEGAVGSVYMAFTSPRTAISEPSMVSAAPVQQRKD